MGRATKIAGISSSGSGGAYPDAFALGTLTAEWIQLRQTSRNAPAQNTSVLRITVPATPPSPIGTAQGAHLYVENPDQSTIASLKLDGTTPLGTVTPSGTWNPQDMGQFPTAGLPWVIDLPDATPGQLIRVYAQAYSDHVDGKPVRAGLAGATPNATVRVPDFLAAKPGNGKEYEPLIKLVSVTKLADDGSTGTLRTPIAVTVDTSVLPDPPPDGWACEVVLVWDADPSVEQVATGTFSVSDIAANSGVIPSGADGITAPHTIALDTPKSLVGVTVYVRSVKVIQAVTNRRGTSRGAILRNTIVPGITPSAHLTVGTTDGTVDIGAALSTSISSEFRLVTVAGQKQLQMLALDMTKATHLSDQFAFDSSLGVQKIAQLSADIIISGRLQVGGGGNKVSQLKVFDLSNQLIGFIGDDSASSGAVGAWFKRCYIGGTSPATAKIIADSLGNVAISGTLIVGPVAQSNSAQTAAIFTGSIQAYQVNAGQFNGLSLYLSKNGITSTIDNIFEGGVGYVGAKFFDNSNGAYSIHWPGGVACVYGGNFNVQLRNTIGDGQLIVQNYQPGVGRRFEFRSGRGATLSDYANAVAGDGQTTTISYTKPGGATGTMTFCMGWLVSYT